MNSGEVNPGRPVCRGCRQSDRVELVTGLLFGAAARSFRAIALQIPEDIEVPVCRRCDQRVLSCELLARMGEAEHEVLLRQKRVLDERSAGTAPPLDDSSDGCDVSEMSVTMTSTAVRMVQLRGSHQEIRDMIARVPTTEVLYTFGFDSGLLEVLLTPEGEQRLRKAYSRNREG